ncbi:membrane protein [Thermomonospora echinospora]|uniref:Membrane protein n=1 Tax=Thermomonospora echinospora TaxID=1992 RepID=A0A1H5ZXI1_9ACTN|nr:YihY/virulence factor BrkB family protein [Thermomonospora echinospora]SEG41159.1 membrane protein [Thermomonospora echinospora]
MNWRIRTHAREEQAREEQARTHDEQDRMRNEQAQALDEREPGLPDREGTRDERARPGNGQTPARHAGDERRAADGAAPAAGQEEDSPTSLSKKSWVQAVKRTFREFKTDNLTDWAAALTYYGVLSIFPAMLVIVSLVGLGGTSLSQSIVQNVGDLAPGAVRDVLANALAELQRGRGGAGLFAIIGLLAAVWSASGYVAAFMRASNAIYDIPEGRPIWKTMPLRIGVTLAALVLLSASAIAVVLSGPLAQKVGNLLGMGAAAVTAWNIAKWPVMLVAISFLFSLLYWASPNVKQGFRWVTPGGILALVVWLLASAGFAFYVANFGSYNKTYGSLAALIIFLVWLWISNIALLLGVELNAELQRGHAIAEGHPQDEEPYVEPRDTRKFPDDLRTEDRDRPSRDLT